MRLFTYICIVLWSATAYGASVELEKRASELRQQIQHHNQLYYVECRSEISNEAYDRLLTELEQLEATYPELRIAGSPTQQVGAIPETGHSLVKHTHRVLSLKKARSDKELADFLEAFKQETRFLLEPKVDGASLVLRYEKGQLTRALTRGNGTLGSDVTQNAQWIVGIPQHLSGTHWPICLEVRGEVYINKADFAAFGDRFSTARNAAAGGLAQLNPNEVQARKLRFLLFEGEGDPQQWRAWGFSVITSIVVKREAVVEQARKEWAKRVELDYATDGVVVKVMDVALRKEKGATERYPRWAVARKFPVKAAQTRLLGVRVQVGRTGKLTPVAELEAVECGGAHIRRASLHHWEWIAQHDVRLNDWVEIERKGGVIPQISRVCFEQRDGSETIILPPEQCPSCGMPLQETRCLNPSCPARRIAQLVWFCSQEQMDIHPLGEKRAGLLVAHGLVQQPTDLYQLTKEQLIGLPGVGEKTAQKLLASIAASRDKIRRKNEK